MAAQVFAAGICTPILIALAAIANVSGLEGLTFGWPSWDVVARCAIVAITASTAHWLVYIGTLRAGAAQVAPAIYTQMLVAVSLGWAIFGDVPDALTILGAGIIIASGLYLWRDGMKQGAETAPVVEKS